VWSETILSLFYVCTVVVESVQQNTWCEYVCHNRIQNKKNLLLFNNRTKSLGIVFHSKEICAWQPVVQFFFLKKHPKKLKFVQKLFKKIVSVKFSSRKVWKLLISGHLRGHFQSWVEFDGPKSIRSDTRLIQFARKKHNSNYGGHGHPFWTLFSKTRRRQNDRFFFLINICFYRFFQYFVLFIESEKYKFYGRSITRSGLFPRWSDFEFYMKKNITSKKVTQKTVKMNKKNVSRIRKKLITCVRINLLNNCKKGFQFL
jgi:hypothetical protein